MSTPYARAKVTAVGASAALLDLSGIAKEMILSSTTDCWINFNDTAVANTGFYLPADTPVTVDVSSKESISVIQDAGVGYLSALELGNKRLITTVHKFFTSNSNLVASDIATTFTGGSHFAETHAATATGDAKLLIVISDTVTADSNLLVTVSEVVTADASLVTA